jgi:hypothetical protein
MGEGAQATVVLNAAARIAWRKLDCQARGFLLSTTEISQHKLLLTSGTAHEMWLALSAQHVEHAANNQYDLQARFYDYQYQRGQDMKGHIAEVKNLAHLLGDVGVKLTDQQVVTKIVCTLPQTFHSFISSWRHVPQADQTLAALTTSLLQEERTLAKWKMSDRMHDEIAVHEEVEPFQTALAAQASSSPLPNNYRGKRNSGRGRERGASHDLTGSYSHARETPVNRIEQQKEPANMWILLQA